MSNIQEAIKLRTSRRAQGSLEARLASLQAQIEALEARLNVLESKKKP